VAYDDGAMRGRSGTRTSLILFATGILLRPILIVPMAPSGPLGGSATLPIALATVVAGSILLAVGVAVGNRPAIAVGILTALMGVPLAVIGVLAGLPMPWPLILVAYNAVLAGIGATAWRGSASAGLH
jgi:hypothetical protein